ncbi:hypothetical protein BXY66_2703 [Shimia isoporae]|uniref:Phytase-like domain-containing protein n=1 Tax=Shimia isoporae TaxID=647720 RepID=A0A4R1N3U5_9RHOB|nr:esterase-like activity of phytase family protein [Shimia isoporae]TCL01388.1 hypothetical protein BXY66_2703 [Shimia isoporae]
MRRRFAIPLTISHCLVLGLVGLSWVHAGGNEGKARHVSSFRWQLTNTWFGGFSAIDLSDDGLQMVALSDRGYWVEADLVREDGEIAGIKNVQMSRVLRSSGKFARHTGWRDSEGLARLNDGSFVVAFEAEHRVERFEKPGALPQKMPWNKDLDKMPLNGGFEALAVDDAGVLHAMPEVAIRADNSIQVFSLRDQEWSHAFTLTRDKQFQPVGADFGPDGRFYVLERGFNGFGFRTRVRSFLVTGDTAVDEKLLFSRGVAGHDNLEGLSVWQDENGAIRLTMISDDNFRFLQKTELVEYVLP